MEEPKASSAPIANPELLVTIETAYVSFQDAVAKRMRVSTAQVDSQTQQYIDDVRKRFQKLIEEARKVEGCDEDSMDEEAQYLAQLRAYILPIEEMVLESEGAIEELSEWGVPSQAIARLQLLHERILKAVNDPKQMEMARSSLFEIFKTYYYWDWYTDWWVGSAISPTMQAMGILSVVCLILASLCMFVFHWVYPGFLFAAAVGASVSIALRPPPLAPYAQTVSVLFRVLGRFLSGIVSGAVGLGLLATGLINLPIQGGMSLSKVINECGSVSSDSGCSLALRAILLSLAIIFGFSERVLASFEQSILRTWPEKEKATSQNPDIRDKAK